MIEIYIISIKYIIISIKEKNLNIYPGSNYNYLLFILNK